MTIRKLFYALGSVVVLCQSAQAGALWRSSTGNAELMAAEIESLYVTLHEKGLLATEPYVDAAGQTVQEILRGQGRFSGAHFPVGVDSVMCQLNPSLCSLTKDGQRLWSNKAGDTINIPSFQLQDFVTFSLREKPAGVSPEEIIAEEGLDCSRFGKSCEDAVRALNKANPDTLAKSYQGTIVLPAKGVQVELRLEPEQLIDTGTELGEAGGGEEVKSGFELPSFERRLVPTGKAETQAGYRGEPLFEQQKDLFSLISFDFAELDDIGLIPAHFRDPVRVEVLDTWLDASHCDLAGVQVISIGETPGIGRAPVACGDPISPGAMNKTIDHAAHIVGIIGAGVNGMAAAGLNPFAKVLYRQVSLNFSLPASRENIAAQLFMDSISEAESADIYNLSWKYQNDFTGEDEVANTIRTLRDKLFVVAAGNDGRVFQDGGCGAFPACLTELTNVITVIGLDRDRQHPNVWDGSNTSVKFHIGAIAADVVSTSGGNGYVAMSGTSQAAPQVAAAAAYVISAHRELNAGQDDITPTRIRNRLIYTSDIFSHLIDAAQGGRLNMKRAMDISRDQVTFRNGDEVIQRRGRLEQIGSDPNVQVIICREPSGDNREIQVRNLRRMVYDETKEVYVVFKDSRDKNRDSPVDRITDCELRTQSQIVTFVSQDGGTETFMANQILDFVSRL
jgi:hypothetical protein